MAILGTTVGCALAASDATVPVESGARALREGQWGEAEEHLRRALDMWPGDPDVQVLFAIAKYHRGDAAECAGLMRQALAGGTRYEARALYYLGMAEMDIGERLEAERAYARLLEHHSESPEAAKVRKAGALTLAREEQTGHSTRIGEISGLALIGYDDHPDDVADRNDGSTVDSSAYALVYLALGMRFQPAHVRASYTHLDYFAIDRLDADSGRLTIDHAFQAGERDSWVPRYAMRLLLLEQRYYETRQDLLLRWNRRWNDDYESDATPYVAYKSHPARDSDEDGWVAGLDARLTRYIDRAHARSAFAAVGADAYSADVSYFGWREISAACGGHLDVAWEVGVDVALRYRKRLYAAASPSESARRADDQWGVDATVSRPLTTWLLGQLNAEHDTNRSNVDAYDFSRNVISLGMLAIY